MVDMILMVIAVLILVPGIARAEDFSVLPSIGTISVSAVLIVIMACAYYVWRRYLRGYIESMGLKTDADTVVRAVEALFGRGNGSTKWAQALEWMNARGWNVDENQVQEALKAAWQIMNTEMLASGEKSI